MLILAGKLMRPDVTPAATNVVPLLRYRNVAAAIEWLCNAFGFEQHFVVSGEGGGILYAQLTSGSGMIMIGPVSDSEFDKLFKQPDEIGGAETQSCYVATKDLDAHFERARANGAEIVFDLQDGPHGAKGYSCRDIEGHLWNFGTYDPWKDKRTPIAASDLDQMSETKRHRRLARELTVLGLCCAALVVSLSVLTERGILDLPINRIAAYFPRTLGPGHEKSDAVEQLDGDAVARVLDQDGELAKLEEAVAKARLELADAISQKERVALELEDISKKSMATQHGTDVVRQDVVAAERARASAEKSADEARQLLEAERQAKELASQASAALQAELTAEQERRALSERQLEETKLRLENESKARETAERALMSAQAEETAAKQKLALAEEELAKVKASSVAQGGASQPAPLATASTETGTKVQAWTQAEADSAAQIAQKQKAARARKAAAAARAAKKLSAKPAPVLQGSPATFPSPQY